MATHFYQQKSSSTEEAMATKLRQLDQLLGLLSEEERLMLLKSELYKAHLRLSRGQSVRRESFEPSSVQVVMTILNEKKLDPYTRFILQALSIDLRAIMQDSSYPTFLTQWRSGPQNLAPQLQGMKRRLDILLPWVEWLNFGGVEIFEQKLLQAVEQAIDSTIARIKNYLLMTRLPLPQSLPELSSMQFFEAIMIDEQSKKAPGQSVLGVVDEVIKSQTPEEKSISGWVPRTEPDPDYVAPEQLPRPVHDWDPKPLDDWLDDL